MHPRQSGVSDSSTSGKSTPSGERRFTFGVISVIALGALVVGTSLVMAIQMHGTESASPTSTTTTDTTAIAGESPSKLGQAFVTGLSTWKPPIGEASVASGSVGSAAQMIKTPWVHVDDPGCRCSADFPYNPLQRSAAVDGMTEHIVYAASSGSPIGVGISAIDMGPNVSLTDDNLNEVAQAYATQLKSQTVTSTNFETIDGSRGIVIRSSGQTNLVESVFQHDNMLYIVFAFTVDLSDNPTPVYDKFIRSFATNAVA